MNLKRLICIHPCFEDEKYYGKFSGYVYQCSLCGAYMAYHEPIKRTVRISKKCYDYYIFMNSKKEGDVNGVVSTSD